MTNFILLLILNSLFIIGFWQLFRMGMLLDWLGLWISLNIPKLEKPLYVCPPCMASFYGTIGYVMFCEDLIYLPIYLICLVGLNTILIKQLNK